ncbi:MarR family winged helix-turn-helix transcriptional regulator [Gottfriedia solisilvae]|uniref:MarR family transcriptional regulator n=1 Tax=Gottfriedia solisilvae TaxID=1516104 RepID=A0A8J3ETZ8_9BACI|nr:MarR family transcriptional regulator [Gottfriedia solisilvae]GGI10794.1 MarR family transcriptional regulator [Gottfriedia solisilvae]
MRNRQPFFFSLNQVTRQFSKSFNENLVPTGLYLAQWSVIRYINLHGPCTQRTICSNLNIEPPTLTRTLCRMESLDLIVRKEGSDKREKMIHLTDKAINQIDDWQEKIISFENEVIKDISDEELEIAHQVFQKMMNNMKASEGETTGGILIE